MKDNVVGGIMLKTLKREVLFTLNSGTTVEECRK